METPTQYGVKYAVHIISSHFGDLVSKVCECLLKRGPLTLQSIVQFTELSNTQVRNCLLVLIQQNCVQAFILESQGGPEDGAKRTTQYLVVFDNIIHRTRFPKFLSVVSRELDKECMELLQGLLEHGRLTLEKMIDRAKENSVAHEVVRANLLKLVHARFVERCPAPEPIIASEEELFAKQQGPKSKLDAQPGIAERVLASAAPMESEGFLFISGMEVDADNEKDSDNFPDVGEKRKHSTLKSEGEVGIRTGREVLWRVNCEEFLHRFRHKACVDNIREQLDDIAATVVSAILEATRSTEKTVRTETSGPLSINKIFEEVMNRQEGRSFTLDHIRAALVLLGSVRGSDDTYQIDLKNIVESAQSEEVESFVLKRYGKDSYRIFRLLSKANRLLETDKISDTAFVDKKETPKILYRLWKDEFVFMEKIMVTGTKQSQFLLWRVNKPAVWEKVLDEMYHATLNLSLRVVQEQENGKEIISIPKDKRTGEAQKQYDRLLKVTMLLESSLMNLDDAIMLFHDF